MASDYCWDVEVKRAMERHEAGEARVIPIILRPVDWKGAPFGKLQALPKDAKPVTTWANRDEAFLGVARGIRAAVEELAEPEAREMTDSHTVMMGDKTESAIAKSNKICEEIIHLIPSIQKSAGKNADELIAKQLNLDVKEVQRCLESLESAGRAVLLRGDDGITRVHLKF